MKNALHKLSNSQLIDLVLQEKKAVRIHEQNEYYLKAQIQELKRRLFGQKRERYEGNTDQLALPFEISGTQEQKQAEHHEQNITYTRKKQTRRDHKGRLPLPEHLPVEEIEIYPEGDLSGQVCIGREVTEELEMEPARFFIKRYIRYKYAAKDGQGVAIGQLPERVIDKGIPGPGLLATILTDKYVDHLPLYRQQQRFSRENIPIAPSTLDGWAARAMDRLDILYDHLLRQTKARGYLQADETPIRVLGKHKKGSTHRGWYWVYYSPVERTVLFDYQPSRSQAAPQRILKEFKGYLQTDGYGVYDKIGAGEGVTHLGCWAHVRRTFYEALGNDKARAEAGLGFIQRLYAVERQAREQGLTPDQRKTLRLDDSLAVLKEMGHWIGQELTQVPPKSPIGKALIYVAERWKLLDGYLLDGTLEIDNNLIDNTIRPIALGRKNYLFAGSHKGAQRAAMIYSFMAMCKMHQVNPRQWLKHVLENILSTKIHDVHKLYPQNFKGKM